MPSIDSIEHSTNTNCLCDVAIAVAFDCQRWINEKAIKLTIGAYTVDNAVSGRVGLGNCLWPVR